jgi:hypothetical protein
MDGKNLLYNDIEDAEKPVFTITKGDIQLEAQGV